MTEKQDPSQNDRLNLSFVKDIHAAGKQMTWYGLKTAIYHSQILGNTLYYNTWTNIVNSGYSVFLEPKWSRTRQSSHSNNNGKYPQTDRPYLASQLLVWRGGREKKPKMLQSCTVNHGCTVYILGQ
jgi:hypothetical protein